jgi:hypothetical protein
LQAGVALGLVVGFQVGLGSESADINAAVRGCPQEAWPVGKSLHLDLKAQLFGLAALGDVLPDLDIGADRADSDGSRLALGRLPGRSQAQGEEGGNDDDEGDGGGDEPLLLFLSSYDFCS